MSDLVNRRCGRLFVCIHSPDVSKSPRIHHVQPAVRGSEASATQTMSYVIRIHVQSARNTLNWVRTRRRWHWHVYNVLGSYHRVYRNDRPFTDALLTRL